MTCLLELFESLRSQIEDQIKPNLRGLVGLIVMGYLPQKWVFITEEETVTLTIDKKGNALIISEALANPDVTVEIDHKYLSTALRERCSPDFPPERSNVTLHTSKGKTAYNHLKKHFGL
jgi:hypothetical protein